MRILHNTICNSERLDRKTAKTTNQSKNENRRNRIRNRIPRRPNPKHRRQNPPNSHRPPKKHQPQPKSPNAKPHQPRAETCKGVIQKLWEENWFSEPKGLDDVHTELARRGFHYDRTAVAHALVDLVKDNISDANRQTAQVPVRTKKTAHLGSLPIDFCLLNFKYQFEHTPYHASR